MKGINRSPKKFGPTDDKVIISSEYFQNDRPSYICDICNQTLVRLTDTGMNNLPDEWPCLDCPPTTLPLVLIFASFVISCLNWSISFPLIFDLPDESIFFHRYMKKA